ncbi:MAG: cytochrome P450 [Deltaproteobacteria bacterium]|nr:cytochrome P450 [Deltaproteobacteria bacterium]
MTEHTDRAAASARPEIADAAFMSLLMDVEKRRNPYPVFRAMREAAPVFQSGVGGWVLTRYDDCYNVLRDPRGGKDWNGLMMQSGLDDWREHPSLSYGSRSLLFLNPPQHTRLRRLVAKAFTPRVVEALTPRMAAVVEGLLDEIEQRGGGDLMDMLAFPLPVTVIGDLLGVPEADRPRFRDAVRANTRTLEIGVSREEVEVADAAALWMQDYFHELIADKRTHRGEDMLTGMLEAEEGGDRLSDTEIVEMGLLLFAAGFETTTNLIGNGLHALLTHPDQLDLLRKRGDLLGNAVEELLRFDPSIQITGRYVLEDIEVGGERIPAGAGVMTLLGAANRDPARFTDPDRLDITRRDIEPLSFGSGIHYCLGSNLARGEGRLAIGKLIERFARIELAEEPRFRDQLGFHGLESLRLVCAKA